MNTALTLLGFSLAFAGGFAWAYTRNLDALAKAWDDGFAKGQRGKHITHDNPFKDRSTDVGTY